MKHKHILIVDDDEIPRMEIGKIVKSDGYRTDFATDCKSAEIHLLNDDYHLVFVDNYMRDFTDTQSMEAGIKLVKRIRKIKPDLPVVIITAHDDLKLTADAIRAGANDYILKESYSEEELLRKTYDWIFFEPIRREVVRFFEVNTDTDEYQLFIYIQSKFKIVMRDFHSVLRELITEKFILIDDNFRIRKCEQNYD